MQKTTNEQDIERYTVILGCELVRTNDSTSALLGYVC